MIWVAFGEVMDLPTATLSIDRPDARVSLETTRTEVGTVLKLLWSVPTAMFSEEGRVSAEVISAVPEPMIATPPDVGATPVLQFDPVMKSPGGFVATPVQTSPTAMSYCVV